MGWTLIVVGQLILAGFLLTGCQTGGGSPPQFESVSPEPATNVIAPDYHFRVGDSIVVTLSGVTDNITSEPHAENVKDDGTITMPNIGRVKAAGKTPAELQRDIYNLYVPRLFTSNLAVTVTSSVLVYYVGGEVKTPNRFTYIGAVTVTRAIQTAGGFTDFANKRNIKLTRADGTIVEVNWNKAIKDPSLDPPVFPGDSIYVKRSIF